MLLQAAKTIGSGLATIGLTNILLSPLQNNNILTKLYITHLITEAIKTIDDMIGSLPQINQLHKFLEEEVPNSFIYVNAKIENDIVIGNNYIHSFSDGQKNNIKKPIYPFHIAGVYVFSTLTNEQYIGSSTNIYKRLSEHKHELLCKRVRSKLYLSEFELNDLQWVPIYYTINYYKLFLYKYPYYVITQGEYDILLAITQILPRILEQALLYTLPSVLNGKGRLVKFSHSKWDSDMLLHQRKKETNSKSVDILIKGKIIKTVNNISELCNVLGIKSRTTVRKYMNHVDSVYSPNYNEKVNIKFPHVTMLLNKPIIHRNDNEKKLPDLNIVGVNIHELEPNLLYVYTKDYILYKTYNSIVQAARDLNSLPSKIRGRELAITRAKNKNKLVSNEVGDFYFIENPSTNRWVKYQAGKYPLVLRDIVENTEVKFKGIRTTQTYLHKLLNKKPDYKTIKSHLEKGTIYKSRFLFLPSK